MRAQVAHKPINLSKASWNSFGDTIGSYLGMDLRATAHASQMPADVLEFAYLHYCELALSSFDMPATPEELAAAFHKSELIAIALDSDTLVGLSMGSLCVIPGTSRQVFYVSGTFTDPSIRRLGVNTRLIYAIVELAYPELLQGIFGMWGQTITFVVRTQAYSVYHGFRKGFSGAAKVGEHPGSDLQEAIDAVADAFGWILDKDNIQRDVYSRRLLRHLVPTLGEHDAIVMAGRYTWSLHMVVSIALRTVYPIRYLLQGLRSEQRKK
ncbi:MAG: hypothetical protein AB1512_19350 [Thermodesulfobacteriota bacterium]